MISKPAGASLASFTLRAAHTLVITLAAVDYLTVLTPVNTRILAFPLALIVAYMATKTIDLMLQTTMLTLTSLSTAACTAFAATVTTVSVWGHAPAYAAIPGCFAAAVGLCLHVHPYMWLPLHASTLVLTATACLLEQWELVTLLTIIAWIVVIVEVATSFTRQELIHEWRTTANALWPVLAWTLPLLADTFIAACVTAVAVGITAYVVSRRTANVLATHYAVAELLGQQAGPAPAETANYDQEVNRISMTTVILQVLLSVGMHWLSTRVPWPGTMLMWITIGALAVMLYRVIPLASMPALLACTVTLMLMYTTAPAYAVTMACASLLLTEQEETLYLHLSSGK